jgi:hypothetical protein
MTMLSPVLAPESLGASGEPPRVIDLGDRYVVTAAGQSNLYTDPARDCGERARVAAVFIALALNPPVVPQVPPGPVPAPPPERSPAAPPERSPVVPPERSPAAVPPAAAPPAAETSADESASPPAPAWREVSAAARFDLAFDEQDAPGAATAGPELGLAAGKGAWGIAVTGGALWPTTSQYPAVSVQEQRFPLGVALVFRQRVEARLALAGQAGLALALMRLQAEQIEANARSTRLDIGGRLVFQVTGPRWDGWALFAAVRGEIFPRVYVLDTDPLKKVGVTHHYWWGASLGISFEAP